MGFIGKHLPRRDFLAVVVSLAATAALAWVYLVYLAINMPAGGMMRMRIPVWDLRYFLLMFLMWAVMMVGMMVPSVTPTVLIYASVAGKAKREGAAAGSTAMFVIGYVVVWTLFSAGAVFLQWGLDSIALLSPMMVSNSPGLGAGLLAAAGVYQFLPVKDKCLTQCRSPVEFIAGSWRNGAFGAFRMGISHGAFCLGCCWALMLLLFVGGVMNLAWIAIITVFVLLEKIMPFGDKGGRMLGIVMIAAAGLFLIIGN